MTKLKTEVRGTGSVYRFTLIQVLKSKANLISAGILLLFVLLSAPLLRLLSDDLSTDPAQGSFQESEISAVYLCNDTEIDFMTAQWKEEALFFADRDLQEVDTPTPIDGGVVIHVTFDASLGYTVQGILPESSPWTADDVRPITSQVSQRLRYCLIAQAGLQAGQIDLILGGIETTVSDFETVQEPEMGDFWIQYLYGIVLLMLCMLSAAYIIRSIVEEKSTKLVELLTVSVSPLALILGKALAIMTYILGLFVLMIGGGALSFFVTNRILTPLPMAELLRSMGISMDGFRLHFGSVAVFLVSLLLAYLLISLISALSGTACSQIEDVEAANTTAMLFTLSGYILSSVLSALPYQGVIWFSSLCPGISAFSAPVRYFSGDLPLWGMLLSWGIQGIMILFFARLCAKVYRDMLLYRGNRLKWKDIFRMARTQSSRKEGKK